MGSLRRMFTGLLFVLIVMAAASCAPATFAPFQTTNAGHSAAAAGSGTAAVALVIHSGLVDANRFNGAQSAAGSDALTAAHTVTAPLHSKWLGIAENLQAQARANSVTSAAHNTKWLRAAGSTLAQPEPEAANATNQRKPVTLPATGSAATAAQGCGSASMLGIQASVTGAFAAATETRSGSMLAIGPSIAAAAATGACGVVQAPSGR